MKGHVRKRKNRDGSTVYEYIIPLGATVDGQRRRVTKSGFKNKEEAEQALIRKLYELGQGLVVDTSDQTVFSYLESWLLKKEMTVSAVTYKNYSGYHRNYITDEIGNIKLKDLQTAHIDILYMKLYKRVAARTVRHIHRMLSCALDDAIRLKMITDNPSKYASLPRIKRTEAKCWDANQLQTFLRTAKSNRWYMAFLLSASTGARLGEILALRWRNIDFNRGTVRISSAIIRDKVGYTEGSTKTAGSVRTIGLPASVLLELERWRDTLHAKDERVFNKKDDFITHTHNGNFVMSRNFAREWYKLLKESGLPPIRFHDLRHTHATMLLQSGINVKAVSSRLGHSTSKLTLDTYSHITPDYDERVLNVLEDSLRTVPVQLLAEDPEKYELTH